MKLGSNRKQAAPATERLHSIAYGLHPITAADQHCNGSTVRNLPVIVYELDDLVVVPEQQSPLRDLD